MWCIPPKQNAGSVCAMENVLETYKRMYNSKNPVVCMDEMAAPVKNLSTWRGSAGEKSQHMAEENVSTRPTRCSGLLATRQIG